MDVGNIIMSVTQNIVMDLNNVMSQIWVVYNKAMDNNKVIK